MSGKGSKSKKSKKSKKSSTRPVRKIKAQDITPTDICPICMNEMEKNDEITQLGCKHKFHKDCIAGWFNTGKKTCPICRQDNILQATPAYVPTPAYAQQPPAIVIINPEITDGSNPPFIAIVLCNDDRIIQTVQIT